jgi:hypothetical protein
MKLLLSSLLLTLFVSCSTTTSFKVPEGADLYVHDMKVDKANYKNFKKKPFSWGTAAGIKYRLEKKGKVVESGTLKSKFRVVSIFWPPVAIAYWPMGFEAPEYDLTSKNRMVRPNFVEKSKK